MGAGAVGDVVVHAHGEGVGLLEHHAHPLAQLVDVDVAVDILPVQKDFPGDLAAFHQVVHPVEGFEQRGLAAAGRTDEGGHFVGSDVHVDVFQGFKVPVVQVQVFDRYFIHKRKPSIP